MCLLSLTNGGKLKCMELTIATINSTKKMALIHSFNASCRVLSNQWSERHALNLETERCLGEWRITVTKVWPLTHFGSIRILMRTWSTLKESFQWIHKSLVTSSTIPKLITLSMTRYWSGRKAILITILIWHQTNYRKGSSSQERETKGSWSFKKEWKT